MYYQLYGVVNNTFLLNLIGQNSLYNIYLGYKNGLFATVKILKKSIYDNPQNINKKIVEFYKEVDVRKDISSNFKNEYKINFKNSQDFGVLSFKISKFFPEIYYVDYNNHIIYEEFCSNGDLNSYILNKLSKNSLVYNIILSQVIVNSLIYIFKMLYEYKGLIIGNINTKNIVFDRYYNLKIIEFSHIIYFQRNKYNHSSDINCNLSCKSEKLINTEEYILHEFSNDQNNAEIVSNSINESYYSEQLLILYANNYMEYISFCSDTSKTNVVNNPNYKTLKNSLNNFIQNIIYIFNNILLSNNINYNIISSFNSNKSVIEYLYNNSLIEAKDNKTLNFFIINFFKESNFFIHNLKHAKHIDEINIMKATYISNNSYSNLVNNYYLVMNERRFNSIINYYSKLNKKELLFIKIKKGLFHVNK